MSMEITIHDRVAKNETFWSFKGKEAYVDEWFLMASPIPIIMIMLGYLLFILKLGPEYMKNKPALKISKILALYNIAQIGLSCYLSYIGTKIIFLNGLIRLSCEMEEDDSKFVILSAFHLYFFAKLTELLDTIFFVLRKNSRQITFLHVYHHSLMLVIPWMILKYEPSYNTAFIGTLNSYVHVVMYTYYYMSAYPELSRYLWWKKYITKFQIVQFIIIIIQSFSSSFFSGCPPSYILQATILFNSFLFTGLFVNFYSQSYKKEKENRLSQ